ELIRGSLRRVMRGLEPEGPGEAVGAARVEDDRLDDAVRDDLLRPDDRVGLRSVRREDGGADLLRAAVDDERDVGLSCALETRRDAGRGESGGRRDAHGATPSTGRAVVSSRPSARVIDWMAAPAVPFARLSTAVTTTTRFAERSIASPISAVFAPVTSAVRGKRPAGSSCTNGSFAYAASH